MNVTKTVLSCLVAGLVVGCLPNPTPQPKPVPARAPVATVPTPADSSKTLLPAMPVIPGFPGAPSVASAPKPYNKVITAEAKTRRGVFITHRIGEKLYFEIPRNALRAEMLLVGRFARAAVGSHDQYGGDTFTERTIRWERNGNRIFLRSVSFSTVVTDSTLPIARAVQTASYEPIINVFPIETFGPDSAPVIDVTRLYTTGVPEFAALKGVDASRSYLESVVAFPENIEIEATQTGSSGGGGVPSFPGFPGGGSGGGDVQSIVAHWSMVLLPRHRMQPRLMDERVGYFGIRQTDFGTNEQRVAVREYIARWRLEKKDPSAVVSEPVKPIVYYIDPATPDQWKPWVRKAILDWQPAFEAAGFKNAILAADPPKDDPDWSPDDVRHTVIRWLPSTTMNAMGPHISDPRTGEILNGSIRMFHNIMNLQRNWYFTQVGPLDPRAQTWPMPDSLMGRLLEYVVAHEIGHTLGLRHDQLGSSLYPADSVRSATWVHTMGHTPSIMDYSRFNYVAQPEDHIALEDLLPRLGPYDLFAIHWGYAPILNAPTAQAERPTLDAWARVQDTVPWYRFAEQNPGGEYGTLNEAVGDANSTWATGWGIKNLERVVGLIPRATLRPGEDNDDLQEIYTWTIRQWQTELGHVVTTVGGSSVQFKSGSQPGPVYQPVSRTRQREAVKFLNEYAFATPTFLIVPSITRRLRPDGIVSTISGAQTSLLRSVMANDKASRLIDYAAAAASSRDVYTLQEFVHDVRTGIWRELSYGHVRIDPYRRALQTEYLAQVNEKLNPPVATKSELPPGVQLPPGFGGGGGAAPSDYVAVLRDELIALHGQIDAAIPRAGDAMTRSHLREMAHRVSNILHPKQ